MVASLEEAARCPKCSEPGRAGRNLPTTRPGVRVVMYTCGNTKCRWYNTGWPIQINPDGTIPNPAEEHHPRGHKQFETPDKLVVAKNIEEVNAYAESMKNTTQGEIRGR